MLNLTLAGGLGRDAEYKTTQSGQELCSFPVGVSVGYGDNKSTVWVDVTKWGKGSQGLANILRKGSKVAVSGELSTREHNGKTYLQCRADTVTVQGTPNREPDGSRGAPLDTARQHFREADLADDIPFLIMNSIW
jgi:single-strand DNA-binding protein